MLRCTCGPVIVREVEREGVGRVNHEAREVNTNMSTPGAASGLLMAGGHHLCIILLTIEMQFSVVLSAPSQYLESSQQRETWLSDQVFYDLEETESPDTNELCPPVPRQIAVESCKAIPCRSDSECTGSQLRCCYNGCVFTCLPQVNPAPHFDWINEPVRQLQFDFLKLSFLPFDELAMAKD
ncbi:WAP four-disulfide core domain protein 1 [Bulinus truncatus]|nr:WAP four-disulfide core domain protein 1 [Bulinus truncatus]